MTLLLRERNKELKIFVHLIPFIVPGVIPASLNFEIASLRTGLIFLFVAQDDSSVKTKYRGKNKIVHIIQNQHVKNGAENV